MHDLNTFIADYICSSRKYFARADARDLADQFMDEFETDLDFNIIVEEIKLAQGHC